MDTLIRRVLLDVRPVKLLLDDCQALLTSTGNSIRAEAVANFAKDFRQGDNS